MKVIHFLCKEFRCRTYLFSSVDESVHKDSFAEMWWLEFWSKYLSVWVGFL